VQLQAKRAAYTAMTDADKREARARASASAGRAKAGAGASCELVEVEVDCAAPDRVVVRLGYPALSDRGAA
jgi:hypothetical protein